MRLAAHAMVLRLRSEGMSVERAAQELEAWADDRKKTVIIVGDVGNQRDIIEHLQNSPRWDHDSFSLSIQKEDTFVSHPEKMNIFSNWPYGCFGPSRCEIEGLSEAYWENLNQPRLWRWQGNRPVRNLFQTRPIRTVIPGLALTRRPAGRYYSGTRKAIHRKLA